MPTVRGASLAALVAAGIGVLAGPAAAAPAARTSSPAPSRAIPAPRRAADQGPQVVVRAPWGSGPGQLGRIYREEGNAEGPMSFTVDANGRVFVLDQVNSRIQIFAAGEEPRSVRLPTDTFEDIVLAHDGGLVVVDRLVAGSLAFLTPDGRIDHEVPLAGPGLRYGGQVTAVFRHADGFWAEIDHRHLVRVADAEGRADPRRPRVPGRLSHDRRQAFTNSIAPKAANVFVQPVAKGEPSLFASVPFKYPVHAILALEPAADGRVFLAAAVFEERAKEPFDLLRYDAEFVTLSPEGKEERRVRVPMHAGGLEQLRLARLGDDGALYHLSCEKDAVVVRRVAR